MDIEGSVKVVFDTQTFDSGFKKREFVVTTKEQYPQDIKFELIKERTDLIDPYKEGDEVKVHFNLRGNEYNGRYYVNLQAWKLDPVGAGSSNGKGADDPFKAAGFPDEPPAQSADEDDLPF